MRIEEFETIPCSQMCRWTPQGPRRPLTQQTCQRSVPGIGLSEIFLENQTIYIQNERISYLPDCCHSAGQVIPDSG